LKLSSTTVRNTTARPMPVDTAALWVGVTASWLSQPIAAVPALEMTNAPTANTRDRPNPLRPTPPATAAA